MPLSFDTLKNSLNLTNVLDKSRIETIGQQVIRGYQIDYDSSEEWREIVRKALDMANQKMGAKSTPWENASNIKFPLIAEASITYASHTLPIIIQNDNVVKAVFQGRDPDGTRYACAERVALFMSYQLAVISKWKEGLDILLHMLPVMGTCFKKIYYDSINKCNVSELCGSDKVVVNHNIQSLGKAPRITHLVALSQNEVVERQRRGLFCKDVELRSLKPSDCQDDEDFPIELLEQHCWIDLDDDGYKEPYIVIVHKETNTVFRIVSRFKKIETNNKKEIIRIIPKKYFVDFHFIRSPDGGFYSVGYGALLLPINASINSLINQLIDSGTLSNMQGGFVGRGLRIKNGEFKFKMGEWKVLDAAMGSDISSNIFPLPTKEPSHVLLDLLNLLIQSGHDLASINDTSMGKQPMQNVTNGVAGQLLEQTGKTSAAINQRLYESLRLEYTELYELNVKHLNQKDYQEVLNDPQADVRQDFIEGNFAIHPVADPILSSEQQRLVRASVIQQLRTANPRAVDTYILQSMHIEKSTIDKLLSLPDPSVQPPPEVLKTHAEIQVMQANVAKMAGEARLEAEKVAIMHEQKQQDMRESDSRINEAVSRSWKMQHDAKVSEAKVIAVQDKNVAHVITQQQLMVHNMAKDNASLAIQAFTAKVNAKQVADSAKILAQSEDEEIKE